MDLALALIDFGFGFFCFNIIMLIVTIRIASGSMLDYGAVLLNNHHLILFYVRKLLVYSIIIFDFHKDMVILFDGGCLRKDAVSVLRQVQILKL